MYSVRIILYVIDLADRATFAHPLAASRHAVGHNPQSDRVAHVVSLFPSKRALVPKGNSTLALV